MLTNPYKKYPAPSYSEQGKGFITRLQLLDLEEYLTGDNQDNALMDEFFMNEFEVEFDYAA